LLTLFKSLTIINSDGHVSLVILFLIFLWVKYVFGPLSFSEIWNWSLYETFDQFSPSSLEMYGFSPFNQIL